MCPQLIQSLAAVLKLEFTCPYNLIYSFSTALCPLLVDVVSFRSNFLVNSND